MSRPTPEQQAAVNATGNVIVVAGAGTGKTRTLVDRCLALLTRADSPVSLDALLVVTFTEAAAAEMRQRLLAALQERVREDPGDLRLAEQLALIDTARISTLHSFCLQLIRDHFHELALDPQLTVLPEEQARLLAEETLDTLLHRHYLGDTPAALAVQDLVGERSRGSDQPVRELVLKIHHYTQTLSRPEAWFEREQARLAGNSPAPWVDWLLAGFAAWRQLWLPVLESLPGEHPVASHCAGRLRALPEHPTRRQIAEVAAEIARTDAEDWRGRKARLRPALEDFFDEAAFLWTVAAPDAEGVDPLVQDWEWMRGPARALMGLAREFAADFAAAKRGLGAVDFHDLEQFALQLLWDAAADAPTPLAHRWRGQLEWIFVDEYQDINEAQDKLLTALGREGPDANRFLVGDVKQSIYRFRLAAPRIFQGYVDSWGPGSAQGQVLPLTGNFRSQPRLLDFVNSLFSGLLRPEVGGVGYGPDQWLRPGAGSPDPGGEAHASPAVELHLVDPEAGGDPVEDDLSSTEREALLVARRLQALHDARWPVRNHDGSWRAVTWGDMAILLRAPRHKAEAFARAFAALALPLSVERGGFYGAREVTDLLSLLQILDNPLQDLPLLAVLRSPLVGLTPDDLAHVRLAARSGRFWTALVRSAETGSLPAEEATRRVRDFLGAFHRWRRLARVAPLSECLEAVLDDTLYEAWLAAEPRGESRTANLRRFVALTRQFDQFQRQGLHRFLRFVEAQQDAGVDPDPAAAATTDAVRLLSVHQSKGLEFPVVVVADLGKPFNLRDLDGQVILDEHYGLCLRIQPPGRRRHYPSLPWWLARRRQTAEARGEELRLLYVALTRARDHLVLVGTASRKALDETWPAQATAHPPVRQILKARSWLGWIGPWLASATEVCGGGRTGAHPLLRWERWDPADSGLRLPPPAPGPEAVAEAAGDAAQPAALRDRLAWRYPFVAATHETAKTSVSALRRRVRDAIDEESRWRFTAQPASDRDPGLSSVDIGTAHHLVMEWLPLERPMTQGLLLETVHQLQERGVLTAAEVAALDLEGIHAFWQSDLGRRLQARHAQVHRELPFTARLSPGDLEALGLAESVDLPTGEYVVVQGIVDLAVIGPDAIWLVDFKTDRVSGRALDERAQAYGPQLGSYALALERIHRRPVTERWLHFLAARQSVRA